MTEIQRKEEPRVHPSEDESEKVMVLSTTHVDTTQTSAPTEIHPQWHVGTRQSSRNHANKTALT